MKKLTNHEQNDPRRLQNGSGFHALDKQPEQNHKGGIKTDFVKSFAPVFSSHSPSTPPH